MTPADLADALACEVDNEYHEGLEAVLHAHADGDTLVLDATPDDGPARRFRALFVEIVESPADD